MPPTGENGASHLSLHFVEAGKQYSMGYGFNVPVLEATITMAVTIAAFIEALHAGVEGRLGNASKAMSLTLTIGVGGLIISSH